MKRALLSAREFGATLFGKAFDLDRKWALIAFRGVVTLVLLSLVLCAPETLREPDRQVFTILAATFAQLASNALLWLARSRDAARRLTAGLFLGDVVLVSYLIYLVHGFESDLFLIYFLVVLMTVLARRPALSFMVAALACLLYGFLFLKSNPWTELLSSAIAIRFSLLWVMAFFSAFVVEDLEAKEELIKKLGHELKTPLTSLRSAVRMVLEDFRDSGGEIDRDAQAKMLSVIDRSTTKLVETVDDILELVRFEMGKAGLHKAEVSVTTMVEECVEEYAETCRERRLDLVADLEPGLPALHADPVKLRQAMVNLLGNAIKFTSPGGSICVGARLRPDAARAGAFCAELFVRDTGPGIDPRQQARIFEKFYQVRGAVSSRAGMGLGLALVKAVAEAHGGSASVRSVPGQGSTFMVRLPVGSDAAPERCARERILQRPKAFTKAVAHAAD